MTAAELRRQAVRPIALRAEEAATALGVSEDYFREKIAPQVPRYRDGRLALYPVAGLEAWLQRNAALPLEDEA